MLKKLKSNRIPLLFIILSVIGYIVSGMSLNFVMSEVVTRILRNSVMVLSLIVPIIAGLGLNFAISIGALAAQTAILFVLNYGLEGYPALLAVVLLSTILAVAFGYVIGAILNRRIWNDHSCYKRKIAFKIRTGNSACCKPGKSGWHYR